MHTKRIQESEPTLALVHRDLPTRTRDVRVHVERLPQVVDALILRARPDVQQDAYVRLQHRPERVEEPPMRVDLFLVTLFHAKYDLGGNDAFFESFEFQITIHRKLCGELVNMCSHWLILNHV